MVEEANFALTRRRLINRISSNCTLHSILGTRNSKIIRLYVLLLKTGRRARILIGSAWIISILFSSPITVLYEEKVIQGTYIYLK